MLHEYSPYVLFHEGAFSLLLLGDVCRLGELPLINLTVSAPVVDQNSTYFSVISGSFRSKENAQKQLNSLINLGYKASYTSINPKGLFRVAYARLKTRKEAAELISKIKTSGADAWLLIEN